VPRPGAGTAPVDWLVVGLGNPGPEYARSPHNVGFLVAARLAERWDLTRAKDRWKGRFAEGRVPLPDGRPNGPRVGVLQPQTYMNESGRSVGPARGMLRVPLERIVVAHDEIDLPFGEVRTRLGGGLAGHNGLRSIKRELGGEVDFHRVRIGVGRPDSTDPDIVAAYVLGRWQQPEADVDALVEEAATAVERTIQDAAEAL
jgi:peptidyl-tRNA hydrolase, PTH1 family